MTKWQNQKQEHVLQWMVETIGRNKQCFERVHFFVHKSECDFKISKAHLMIRKCICVSCRYLIWHLLCVHLKSSLFHQYSVLLYIKLDDHAV